MPTQTNPVNWFEIPVSDLKRATAFYENILNYKLSVNEIGALKMAWFPMVEGAPGSTGTLIESDAYTPSYEGSLVYFSVENIEAVLEKVKQNGGKIINGKMSIGEYGFVAHFEDSEGNRVALHSNE
ncbi:VOC family protein [candidate division KSB1 bacterium]|nr:VOC family protein [candidate division KSB1 bacterium]